MITPVRLSIIGDYSPEFHPHRATEAALHHAADRLQRSIVVEWLPTPRLTPDGAVAHRHGDAVSAR